MSPMPLISNAEHVCKKCGKCCTYIDIPGEIRKYDNDISDWLDYHNIEIRTDVIRVHNECMWLQGPYPDLDDVPTWHCAIYDIRPGACRKYRCEKIEV